MSTNKNNPRSKNIARIIVKRKRLHNYYGNENTPPSQDKSRRILKGPVTLTIVKKKINQTKPVVLTEEQRKTKKKEMNRENAKRFRQRKKVYVKELENETRSLKEENTTLNSKLDLISQENLILKQQIAQLEAKILQEQSIQDFKEIEEQQEQEQEEEEEQQEEEEEEEEEEQQELQEEEKNALFEDFEHENVKIEQYEQEFQQMIATESELGNVTNFEDNNQDILLGDITTKLGWSTKSFSPLSTEGEQPTLEGFENFLFEGFGTDQFEENENWV
ncbi:basic-leucine zipper transcription factor f-related [Anaeramoeba flamelloides]|uniref:Basic-leucine zipper transcription factor f-related n=1 Tax=Anaeramoeba flamelloides TaxID=1746091 RepID=A0AAV7ZPX7_9EUKA|nr:basic-leucine zipper transcription factor f-related [Anaeramoeba flamelloides]